MAVGNRPLSSWQRFSLVFHGCKLGTPTMWPGCTTPDQVSSRDQLFLTNLSSFCPEPLDVGYPKTKNWAKHQKKLKTNNERIKTTVLLCKVFLYNIPKANDTFTQHKFQSHPGKKPCIRNLGTPRLSHRRYASTHGLRGDLINSTTRTSKCRHFIPFTSSTEIYVNR